MPGDACPDAGLDLLPGRPPGGTELILGLQIEPDLGRHPEVLPETKRGVRREGALTVHDVADPVRRHADVPGERRDRDAQRTHELLPEDLTRGDRVQLLPAHHISSAVVHDLDIMGTPS
jgi:hypothetical protein